MTGETFHAGLLADADAKLADRFAPIPPAFEPDAAVVERHYRRMILLAGGCGVAVDLDLHEHVLRVARTLASRNGAR